MLSAVNGHLTVWVTALPGAQSAHLSAGDFVLAGRHFFNLVVATTIATQLCLCAFTNAECYDVIYHLTRHLNILSA